MTDEQLTEWCVGKVREWLATGHPSAWRAWGGVWHNPTASRLRILALSFGNGHWTMSDGRGKEIKILDLPMPCCFGSYAALHTTGDAIAAILNPERRIGRAITSEEAARLLEEAAAVATNPTDWRTLDTVPEDYYAL